MSFLPTQHNAAFSRLAGRCLFLLLSFLLLLQNSSAQLNNDTSPTSQFKSRPDLHAPIIDFSILRPEFVTPGYIFLAPYRNVDPAPYIYDNWGNLVWSGAASSGPKTAHAPKVCKYKGEDHLCYFVGNQHQGFARGHGVIMDKHYRTVKTVESSGAAASSDMHEFRLTPYSNGTTALMTVYQPRQYDLTTNPRFNVEGGMGWIVEGMFQEVDIETGRVVFEWRSLDHVDPGEGWTMPHTTDTSGDGLHELTPWDYFHLNSIDKNRDGDYLLSGRHVSAIYKISGKDGSIMWQLGGNSPSFKQDFIFSYQHHARWHAENGTHTILSLYDNGSNSFNGTAQFSHGWLVEINHVEGTAHIIKEFGAPEPSGGLLSGSQGNMQILPGGNVHIGWGEHAAFTEHTSDGKAVMYAKVASRPSNVMVYRSNKFNWTGTPVTKPDLWTYSLDGRGQMTFYVSWNGATEVKGWNFYTSEKRLGPFVLAGHTRKNGFETVFTSKQNVEQWAYAQALDVNGRPMQDSVVARTFVPSEALRKHCGLTYCDNAERSERNTPFHAHVQVDEQYLSTGRGYDTKNYYHGFNGSVAVPTSASSSLPLPVSTVVSNSTKVSMTSSSDKVSGEEQDDDNEQESSSSSSSSAESSYIGSSLGLLILGMVIGCVLSFFLTFLRQSGVFSGADSVNSKLSSGGGSSGRLLSERLSDGMYSVTKSAFGAKVLGKYQRVREKEMDGMESGSSSTDHSSDLR